jgi:hypothetical protein
MEGWTGDHREGGEGEAFSVPDELVTDRMDVATFRNLVETRFVGMETSGPVILLLVPDEQTVRRLQADARRHPHVAVATYFSCMGLRGDLVIAAPIPEWWPRHKREEAARAINQHGRTRVASGGLFIEL